jgi:hypothetical protein
MCVRVRALQISLQADHLLVQSRRVNEEYLNALATRLSTLTDDYETSVANLEEYVNSHTEP